MEAEYVQEEDRVSGEDYILEKHKVHTFTLGLSGCGGTEHICSCLGVTILGADGRPSCCHQSHYKPNGSFK